MPRRYKQKRTKTLYKGTKENYRYLINIDINYNTNWNKLKKQLNFKRDREFVECLLSITLKFLSCKSFCENLKITLEMIEENLADMLTIDEPLIRLDENVGKVNERNAGAIKITDKYDTKLTNKSACNEVNKTMKIKKADHEKLDTGDVIKHTNERADDIHCSSKSVSVLNTYFGNKLCKYCDGSHSHPSCPLNYSSKFIFDSISLEDWRGGEGFAIASLPSILHLKDGKIFTLVPIPFKTQFGPLVGVTLKEVEISDDSSMEHVWELSEGKYICTEDLSQSNWMRWVCPAPTRNQRNLVALSKNGSLYFIALKLLEVGDELLYWAEPSAPWSSKNMEKTNCGGCNLKFTSPMGYRLHCSVFHDPTLSLSVRKYHCKVCAEPILGKQNIINHAASMHGGKGAYQCQFCSKFFLRLNYLEMHRNYGCPSNPHRSRPLCHHCGRKFCQPQKLKVHIKRMHSGFCFFIIFYYCLFQNVILNARNFERVPV